MTSAAQHPFKFDNTIYKAVYLNEAFHLMDSMQNYLLLDVRSPGEYADTSRATALNIGRIRGSVNITIDSVPARMAELAKYKDQPVFIYCSHSQRSRRVSKLLAENGFKKVYNINGGMTLLNESDSQDFPYKDKVLTTRLAYKNIDSKDALHFIKNTPGLVIIDIRTPAEFESRDTLQQNNIGHLKNALNFPQSVFAEKLSTSQISVNSPVLLYDRNGYNSMDVVDILKAKGF
ncbi:MAG TPA: rhodanese-like domain-containing protein, partial [Puia sp.]|nr:rhodanese-like domain-containing protein [Puia sp.]